MNPSAERIPGHIRWRCRRGMRELDVLLTKFLDTHWPRLNDQERGTLEQLLETEDPLLMDWVMGRARPQDTAVAEMIDRVVAGGAAKR